MNPPLFRDEVIYSLREKNNGHVVLMQPISLILCALLSFAFAIFLLVFLFYGEYARKVRVQGQIVPSEGAIKIMAPQLGYISNKFVREGQKVEIGDILYELSSMRSDINGSIDKRIDDSLAEKRSSFDNELKLQIVQFQQRATSINNRIEIIKTEIFRISKEIGIQRDRIDIVNKTSSRYKTLREQGFVSEMQLSQVESEQNEQLARMEVLERGKLNAQRELVQAQDDAQQIASQIPLLRAQSSRSVATVDQELAEHQGRNRLRILSPIAGTVTALTGDAGQSVSTGNVLATVIPTDGELEADLFIPSRAIGFVQAGQRVFIRIDAFPYQKFGQIEGIVKGVDRSPMSSIDNIGKINGAMGDPSYRVRVRLAQQSINAYGKAQRYLPGMALEADIQQDRRRLMEWIVDPLISMTKIK